MIKFKQKIYGEKTEVIKKAIKNNPFSVGTFVLSGGNLATNLKRHKDDREYQIEQLNAMKDLTSTLTGVNKTLKKTNSISKENAEDAIENGSIIAIIKKKKYFSDSATVKFRKKNFSILGDTIKGANIGLGIGTLGNIYAPKTLKIKKSNSNRVKEIKQNYNSLNNGQKRLAIAATGAIIGAGLGALYGLAKEGSDILSRRSVNSHRLMPDVFDNLKKLSFKEGVDYTRSPKEANQLKTRVCIVITKNNGDLKILINTVSDPKLKDISTETLKNIPNSSAITNTVSNNFNEVVITTISDGSADAGLITGICERFIRSGYPVYLIEVG